MSASKKREIPQLGLPIVETHFHLDYLKSSSAESILAEARKMGVSKFITISVNPENLDQALALAKAHDDLWCTQGIHPHNAKDFDQEVRAKIEMQAREEKVVAIGEIGLDYYYQKSPREGQIKAFRDQLCLAAKLNLPVVIHSRDAEEDTLSILQELSGNLQRKGVIHSFTSSQQLAQSCVELGFYIGINGIITFKNAQDVRDVVKAIPLEYLLLETDAPFLTPDPYRGHENAPKYLPLIAEKIAQIKGLKVEEVLKVCYQNSLQLFFSH